MASEHLSERRIIRETGAARELAAIAEPVLQDLGFRLVRVLVSGRDGGTVQIMAERPDGTLVIEDCTKISRELSPIFDLADAYPDRHNLEVSSPGVDRPLVRVSDFENWRGYEAKIELSQLVDGRKRFRGLIDGVDDGEVRLTIEVDGDPVTLGIDPAMIESAKLVATDELMRASLKRQKEKSDG